VFSQTRGTPAPIDPAELSLSLQEFGTARMLPRAAYVDPAVLAWEQANIFSGWMCVGRATDIADPGDQKAVATGQGGVLVVRDESGEVQAFANVCRHRGHELLPCGAGAVNKKAIVCPYHAWTYRLDGSLRLAPTFKDVAGFNNDDFPLARIRVVDWHGWLFVDPSGESGPFDEHVGAAENVIAPYSPRDLKVVARHDYELATNWKVIVENYQECYHCPMIHPELCQVSPPLSGEDVALGGSSFMAGWMDLSDHAQTMSLDGRSEGTTIQGLSEQELRTVMYVVGFPNLLISLHPDYVMTHVLTPLAADRTHVECTWAFPAEVAERPGFDPSYAVDFWDLTNRQDWAACESVQRGLSSPHAVPGPMAPEETGVYDFVTRMARAYAGTPAS
jgi:Rieske 2Fe-2S family protein